MKTSELRIKPLVFRCRRRFAFRMETNLAIDSDTMNTARAGLHQSETLDEITERLLRQYVATRNVERAAEKVRVELAVSRAFADARGGE
jgi:hypothetical protein